mmetsp:Transcript_5342/g.7944  ORF Transcript_5342/g.7944 Transcript_5342/m.7944 type:complete len:812 (+) Transcript_5342:55-2490(+)
MSNFQQNGNIPYDEEEGVNLTAVAPPPLSPSPCRRCRTPLKNQSKSQNDIAAITTMQVFLEEIKAMKTTNQKQTIELQSEREKLVSLEERILHTLGHRVRRDQNQGPDQLSPSLYHNPPTEINLYSPAATPNERRRDEMTLSNENEGETSTLHTASQSCKGKEDDKVLLSPTFRSLSCFFRLLFASLFLPMVSDYVFGIASPLVKITRVSCPSFLLLSVVFSGVHYYFCKSGIIDNKRVIIGLVGWFINLVGAIVFAMAIFTIEEYMYDKKTGQINPILQIAFGLLAAGHAMEQLYTPLKETLVFKRKILLILLAITAYTLPAIIKPEFGIRYGITIFLLITHAIVQYASLFWRTTVTASDKDQDTNKDESQSNNEPEPEPVLLPDDMLDTFALMMISNDAKTWNFGFLVFFMQAGLSIMILGEQSFLSKPDVPFGVPTVVSFFVSFSQFWALLLAIFWQTDILTSVRMLDMLWYRNGNWPYEEIYANDGKFCTWLDKVMIPNLLRATGGLFVLGTSFVIIVKSEDAIDLFKDFTALILISEIDNIAFRLSNQGYFGKKLKKETQKSKEICLVDDSKAHIFMLPVRLFIVLVVFLAMLGGWSYFIHGQYSRRFFLMEHPNCLVMYWDSYNIGNGVCEKDYNTQDCNYDGGDCIQFNNDFPNCTATHPFNIQDDVCDGGDYNTEECGFDGGDCIKFNEGFPNCDVVNPSWIGNGKCDDSGDYNTEKCGYDGGDCYKPEYPDCKGINPSYIGNGICDGGDFNTEECGYDGGDCIQFKTDFPYCTVRYPHYIGDGDCYKAYNTTECGFDGGDCL